MKIVINACYGGFSLSDRGLARYNELTGHNQTYYYDIQRDDPHLVQVIEELGFWSGGYYSKLKIVEIPDDVDWQIQEYDGNEWVAEKHRIWS